MFQFAGFIFEYYVIFIQMKAIIAVSCAQGYGDSSEEQDLEIAEDFDIDSYREI